MEHVLDLCIPEDDNVSRSPGFESLDVLAFAKKARAVIQNEEVDD